MIWADTSGTIGWQAVGIAPIRQDYSGLVPVPGDGRFEWNGYLPIIEKPSSVNPKQGYLATANQNVTPETYDRWDAIGYTWADAFRGRRIEEVLGQEAPFDLDDMKALQTDYFSVPATELMPYLNGLSLSGKALEVRKRMEGWDYMLNAESVPAAIYVAWENEIRRLAHKQFVPVQAKAFIPGLQLERILQWLRRPEAIFGNTAGRDAFLAEAFEKAIAGLTQLLGDNPDRWQYGQADLKHTLLQHPLSAALGPEFRDKLELGPYPRGGNGYTPGSTGNNYRQSSGASFRVIIPVGDWDQAVGTNSPGQSGDPESPFFGNLFESWAKDQYFPLWYSRDSVLRNAYSQTLLSPQ
jgi:penicillin amidase